MKLMICEVCGKEDLVRNCRIKNYKTCSRVCGGIRNTKLNTFKIKCETCGKEFVRNRSDMKKGVRKFCSNECKGMGSRGKNGTSTKYFNFNRRFFKNIDSWEKAYILGWVASDGNVRDDAVVIVLTDLEIINYINDQINPENFTKEEQKDVGKTCYKIRFCSIEMVKDLRKQLRIKPGKKSHQLKFPEWIDKKYWRAFIQGYLEGDGWISIVGNNRLACGICGECPDFLDWMIENLNFGKRVKNKYSNCYSINITGPKAEKFLDWMYKDSKFQLQRKYQKYLKHKDLLNAKS